MFSGQWINPLTTFGIPEIALAGAATLHALTYAAYVWMVGRAGAVFAAQVSYLVTGFGVFWAMLALGERKLEGRATGLAPATPLKRASSQSNRLVPIGTPISVSGLSDENRRRLEDELAPLGFHVGGGTSVGGPGSAAKWVNLDAPMVPGSTPQSEAHG